MKTMSTSTNHERKITPMETIEFVDSTRKTATVRVKRSLDPPRWQYRCGRPPDDKLPRYSVTDGNAGSIGYLDVNAPTLDVIEIAVPIEPYSQLVMLAQSIVERPPGPTAHEPRAPVVSVRPSPTVGTSAEYIEEGRDGFRSEAGPNDEWRCTASVASVAFANSQVNRCLLLTRLSFCQLKAVSARHCPPPAGHGLPRPATMACQKLRMMSLVFHANPHRFFNHLPRSASHSPSALS